jgi:hypothetical protein
LISSSYSGASLKAIALSFLDFFFFSYILFIITFNMNLFLGASPSVPPSTYAAVGDSVRNLRKSMLVAAASV